MNGKKIESPTTWGLIIMINQIIASQYTHTPTPEIEWKKKFLSAWWWGFVCRWANQQKLINPSKLRLDCFYGGGKKGNTTWGTKKKKFLWRKGHDEKWKAEREEIDTQNNNNSNNNSPTKPQIPKPNQMINWGKCCKNGLLSVGQLLGEKEDKGLRSRVFCRLCLFSRTNQIVRKPKGGVGGKWSRDTHSSNSSSG